MALPDKLLKEKVKEVRQLVPNFSNSNDIVLILEHYNYNVEQTVSAILENGGMDALQSWTQTSKGPINKQKKKQPKKNSAADKQTSQMPLKDSNGELNDVNNGSLKTSQTNKYVTSPPPQNSRNPHAGLEKSYKELHRQITSLTHLKIVFNEKVEKSYKRINEVFKELHGQLTERQVELTKQLDNSKAVAMETMEAYEEKSKDLRMKIDRAQSMNAGEVAELRNEIKDFVAQKRHFEEVAHSCKFNCDFNNIILNIQGFGEVQQAKVIVNHQDMVSDSNSTQPSGMSESNGVSLRVLNQSESLIKYEENALNSDSSNVNSLKGASVKVVDQKPFKRPESTRSANKGRRPNKPSNRNGSTQDSRNPTSLKKPGMPASSE